MKNDWVMSLFYSVSFTNLCPSLTCVCWNNFFLTQQESTAHKNKREQMLNCFHLILFISNEICNNLDAIETWAAIWYPHKCSWRNNVNKKKNCRRVCKLALVGWDNKKIILEKFHWIFDDIVWIWTIRKWRFSRFSIFSCLVKFRLL